MRPLSRREARAAIYRADPYLADRAAMLRGLGYSRSEMTEALGVPPAIADHLFPKRKAGSGVAAIIYRLQKYLSIPAIQNNAERLLRRCGCTSKLTIRIARQMYIDIWAAGIAESLGCVVSTVHTRMSNINMYTGSINRENAMVRLSGLSKAEWERDMATERISPWVTR